LELLRTLNARAEFVSMARKSAASRAVLRIIMHVARTANGELQSTGTLGESPEATPHVMPLRL
jgi:hypothetical protein